MVVVLIFEMWLTWMDMNCIRWGIYNNNIDSSMSSIGIPLLFHLYHKWVQGILYTLRIENWLFDCNKFFDSQVKRILLFLIFCHKGKKNDCVLHHWPLLKLHIRNIIFFHSGMGEIESKLEVYLTRLSRIDYYIIN